MTAASKDMDFIYHIIADQAMMSFLLFDSGGQLVYANRLAADLLEFSLGGDTAAISLKQFYPERPNERRIKCLSVDMIDMQGLIQDVLIQKLNGATFIATLGVKHVDLQGQRYLLLMIQDVTLQKKLQREITEKQAAIQEAYQDLLKQNKKLKELDVAKDRFIAMTTHELRTPISAIVASAEILKLKLYDSEKQQDEFTTILFEQGHHLLNLVNDILDFAKIQAGRMDYYVEQKNLVPFLQSEIEGREAMARAAQVQLTFVAPQNPVVCYFDDVRARQVLGNLLNNAINYNKPKGSVTLTISETDDTVSLAIVDTGIGIAAENYEKIFNEFETIGAIANHSKGTGLGLPISLKIARRMGGNIQVLSELGKGSTFTFTLPKTRVLQNDDYRSRPSSSGDIAA